MPGRPWSITLGPVSRRGILIIYRAQIWAVSVKFKLKINELFTRHRPRLAPTGEMFSLRADWSHALQIQYCF